MANITELKNNLREIGLVDSMNRILNWDQQTYMPDGAAEFRAEQSSYMSRLFHRKLTGDTLRNNLKKFIDLETGNLKKNELSTRNQRMLQEVYRDYRHAISLPQDFVGKLAEAGSRSVQAWKKAKEADDFNLFRPHLEKMVNLEKQKAEYFGYEDKPLDALLDFYEPGMTTKKVTELFVPVKERLTTLAERIKESGKEIDDSFMCNSYPESKQRKLSREMLKTMGYDFDRGRQDVSAHPFTVGFHPTDTRFTNRFAEGCLASSISSAVHEGGHALYEQGLNPDEFGNPLGEAISYGIHESQSRLWENMVGASRPYWQYWLPKLKEYFSDDLEGMTLGEWYRAYNKVEPSLIRVDSDEVHYNLHILVRFEIEDRLINSNFEVKHLPEIWNEKMEHYIGLKPETDTQGVLQDIHWSWGQFGYFPSYSLGTFYSVQIFNQAKEEIPELMDLIARGELIRLKEWLNENVHKLGRRFKAGELIKELTGNEPSSDPFLDYLEEKYSQIYDLS